MGVDGSDAALDAVRWAVVEAAHRDVPLRLVHAIKASRGADAQDGDFGLEREYAQTALRAAAAVARSVDGGLEVDTDIVWGAPERALVAESENATLVCVGSVGIGAVSSVVLGSTAAMVAAHALCSVAVIRRGATPDVGCIAVATDLTPDSDRVVEAALEEARLFGCPVVIVGVRRWESGEIDYDALDRHAGLVARRYPEVPAHVVRTNAGIVQYLADRADGSVGMVVVGDADADAVARIVGAHNALCHGARRHSVLVVR
ncbi:universal stress protein [Mycobacterium sp. GA-2829]|uniref:universal stress protein n=1 Tax=Mycobacterium sp. GA-2829 TaxID=1772283 RepID=UPI0018D213B1|nr:universal stress protein [Mycobacterium sp. GA-2829]